MDDLHVMFDAFAGYLVGMAAVEVVIKPTIVRLSKRFLRVADRAVSWIPDWMYSELDQDS